jgi:hypothetical protein
MSDVADSREKSVTQGFNVLNHAANVDYMLWLSRLNLAVSSWSDRQYSTNSY